MLCGVRSDVWSASVHKGCGRGMCHYTHPSPACPPVFIAISRRFSTDLSGKVELGFSEVGKHVSGAVPSRQAGSGVARLTEVPPSWFMVPPSPSLHPSVLLLGRLPGHMGQ